MASGGFHDSSTHTGSFHSSGGGGSHSSSGGYGSYDSGGGSGGGGLSGTWVWTIVYFALCWATEIDEFENLSGKHLITLGMVIAMFILFSPKYGTGSGLLRSER